MDTSAHKTAITVSGSLSQFPIRVTDQEGNQLTINLFENTFDPDGDSQLQMVRKLMTALLFSLPALVSEESVLPLTKISSKFLDITLTL